MLFLCDAGWLFTKCFAIDFNVLSYLTNETILIRFDFIRTINEITNCSVCIWMARVEQSICLCLHELNELKCREWNWRHSQTTEQSARHSTVSEDFWTLRNNNNADTIISLWYNFSADRTGREISYLNLSTQLYIIPRFPYFKLITFADYHNLPLDLIRLDRLPSSLVWKFLPRWV